jgi:hypothetical protein
MGVTLRRSKYVGFLTIAVGILLVVVAAVLPVSPDNQRLGPFRVEIGRDNCGPAGEILAGDTNGVCKSAAQKRMVAATAVGLVLLALGMALYAGGDEPAHASRIVVGAPRVRRRSLLRSPGGRRYGPG